MSEYIVDDSMTYAISKVIFAESVRPLREKYQLQAEKLHRKLPRVLFFIDYARQFGSYYDELLDHRDIVLTEKDALGVFVDADNAVVAIGRIVRTNIAAEVVDIIPLMLNVNGDIKRALQLHNLVVPAMRVTRYSLLCTDHYSYAMNEDIESIRLRYQLSPNVRTQDMDVVLDAMASHALLDDNVIFLSFEAAIRRYDDHYLDAYMPVLFRLMQQFTAHNKFDTSKLTKSDRFRAIVDYRNLINYRWDVGCFAIISENCTTTDGYVVPELVQEITGAIAFRPTTDIDGSTVIDIGAWCGSDDTVDRALLLIWRVFKQLPTPIRVVIPMNVGEDFIMSPPHLDAMVDGAYTRVIHGNFFEVTYKV